MTAEMKLALRGTLHCGEAALRGKIHVLWAPQLLCGYICENVVSKNMTAGRLSLACALSSKNIAGERHPRADPTATLPVLHVWKSFIFVGAGGVFQKLQSVVQVERESVNGKLAYEKFGEDERKHALASPWRC